MKLVSAFTGVTGVKVNVSNESFDAIQPKASVAANTGQGPDMVWGLHSLPQLFAEKCVDVTDVAEYLGGSEEAFAGAMTAKALAARRVSAEGQEGLRAFLEKRKPSWNA
jgi:ABC-type glycerol-3-phosphate transport system substrate-binding protein